MSVLACVGTSGPGHGFGVPRIPWILCFVAIDALVGLAVTSVEQKIHGWPGFFVTGAITVIGIAVLVTIVDAIADTIVATIVILLCFRMMIHRCTVGGNRTLARGWLRWGVMFSVV